MKKMERILLSNLFVRIHRSYIVSLDHIVEFDKVNVYLQDKILPIGQKYKGQIEKFVLTITNGRNYEGILNDIIMIG